ncbi:MAG: hypothetical protein Q7V43_35515 [Myxococcales bacterium]|nr:hypothetical protein [Myxococcales bacterium]
MNPALRKVLDDSDDPEGCEVPGDNWAAFPYDELAASVGSIQETLRNELNLPFDRDGYVQDASFHDELRQLHPDSFRANGVVVLTPEIAVRFSNFGRLYTIYSAVPDTLTHYPLDRIRAVVELRGWRYVPADELGEIYDGKNRAFNDGRTTWWIRFFDYL